MPGAMDLCSFGFVLSFRNKIDSLKKAWRCIRVSLCFFVLLLYVFDIFHSVLTNYKMILLLSIQFHGFRYPVKKQSVLKNFGSFINAKMAQHLLKKPKELQLSNFSAMKRFVCIEILRYQNPYPYIDGLFLRTTGRIANVPMEERERQIGNTGYTFRKSLNLWLNGFTAFSVLPLRMAILLGLMFSGVGFLFGIWVVVHKFLTPDILAGYSSLMAVTLFVSGILMMMLGLIGEYVGRIYISINNSPQYVIREAINIGHMQLAEKNHDQKD